MFFGESPTRSSSLAILIAAKRVAQIDGHRLAQGQLQSLVFNRVAAIDRCADRQQLAASAQRGVAPRDRFHRVGKCALPPIRPFAPRCA